MHKLPEYKEVKREINENRDHSFFQEILNRHKEEEDRVIIDYLKNDITYKDWFRESVKFAFGLKANDINKGNEFVVCMDKTPETAYLVGAANIVGAKINLISEKFAVEYIKEIIEEAGSKIIFVQDVKISKLKELLKDLDVKVIPVSFKRSLKDDSFYKEGLAKEYYYLDEEKYNNALNELTNIYSLDDFMKDGAMYAKTHDPKEIKEQTGLDTPFTITYSSGTTKKGKPKGIIHGNRHYITMGRYHDPEVSGIPSMRSLTTYSNIPIYSNSFLSTGLTDNLIVGGKIVFDPVDDPEYFMYGMKEYGANMNIATTSTWLTTALNYYNNNSSVCLDKALFNFAAGESLSTGEEKYLNRFLKDVKAGVSVTHTPFSVSVMSTGGADCEHGSLFIRMFRTYYRVGKRAPIGMKPYGFIEVKALREDGTYADPYEYGKLVANSDCTMLGYNHNEKDTESFYVKDAYGKRWGDMRVHGYIDDKGNVTMKGRINSLKKEIPTFLIEDEISLDTKKIMACTVVNVAGDDEEANYVAHIMFQPDTSINYSRVLNSATERCVNKFGNDIRNKLSFRIHDSFEKYPVTASIKRDNKALMDEGLEKVVSLPKVSKNSKKLVRKRK